MPIDIDEFELAEDDFVRGNTKKKSHEVVEFLAYNPEQAYSRQEIQSALDMSVIGVLATLSRLENEGIVRHKGEYWAIAEDIDSPDDLPDTIVG